MRPHCGTCLRSGNAHLCQYDENAKQDNKRSKKAQKTHKAQVEAPQLQTGYSPAALPPLNSFFTPTLAPKMKFSDKSYPPVPLNAISKSANSVKDSSSKGFSYPTIDTGIGNESGKGESVNEIRLAPISVSPLDSSSNSSLSAVRLPPLDSLSASMNNTSESSKNLSAPYKVFPNDDVHSLVEKLKANDKESIDKLKIEAYSSSFNSHTLMEMANIDNSPKSMQSNAKPRSTEKVSSYNMSELAGTSSTKATNDELLLGKADPDDYFPRPLHRPGSTSNMKVYDDGKAATPNGTTANLLAAANSGTNIQEQGTFKALKILPSDSVNLNDGYSPLLYNFARISNFGPLSWMSSVLKDPMVRLIRDQVIKHKKESLFNATTETEVHHRDKFTQYLGMDDVAPFDDKGKTPLRHNMNGIKPETFGNRPSTCPFATLELAIAQILKVLPVKRVVWLSIERFFSDVYPLVPYLDEFSFVSNIESMLESNHLEDVNSEEKFTKLNLKKKLDFAIVGILLIVLKFSQESVWVNGDAAKHPDVDYTEEESYLLEHPINDRVEAVAQMCLSQFKLFSRCALPVFQLALLLKEYETINGCSDNTSADSQIYITMLVQIAVSIGLNRDPCNFDMMISKGKVGNLWRKIWYGLIAMDLKQNSLYGNPKVMNFDFFDTKLPSFDESSSNIRDYEMEKTVIEKIKRNYRLQRLMLDLEEYVSRLNHVANVQLIMKKLWNLESTLLETLGTFKDVMRMPIDTKIQQVRKCWNFMIYIQAIGLIDCVCHNLYLHYQKVRNTSACLYFAEKGISTWLQVFANFELIATKCPLYFGLGHDMAIIQMIMPLLHRGWINLMSLFIGSLLVVQKYGEINEQTKKVQIFKKVCELVTSAGNWYLPCLKRCSSRHFYAWKLLKAHTYVIYLTRTRRFIFKALLHLNNYLEQISVTESLELLELCKFDNYKFLGKESPAFKDLKKKLDHRTFQSPTEDLTPTSIDLSVLDLKPQMGGATDINFNEIFPVENWTKPMQEDMFWKNLFLQRENIDPSVSAMQMPESEPNARMASPFGFEVGIGSNTGTGTGLGASAPGHSPEDDYMSPFYMSVRGIDLYGVTPSMNTENSPAATDRFVDKTIYDMFS